MSVFLDLITAVLIAYSVGMFVYCLGSIHNDTGGDR